MKFFKLFIIIQTLSCLTIAIPNETEKRDLNNFLQKIQQQSGITSRTVKINGAVSSLNEFFKSTISPTPTGNGPWTITEQDIYKTGYLIQTVVSCEYSETMFNLVTLMSKVITKHYKNDISEYNITMQQYYLDPMKNVVSSMIMTLIGLLNYTKHHSLKHQEILNILLSLYIYIMHADYKESTTVQPFTINHIEYLPTILHQVDKYLKIFIMTHCRDIDDFEQFRQRLEDEAENLPTCKDIQKTHVKKLQDLSRFIYEDFVKQKYNDEFYFVLTPKPTSSSGLRQLIGRQTISRSVDIKWDSTTTGELSYIFDTYISKNPSGLHSLLKFEKIVIDKITRLIMAFISNELRILTDDRDIDETRFKTMIEDKIIATLDTYIGKFRNSGQPIYLINNMSIIKTKLWSLCNNNKKLAEKKTELGKYIYELIDSNIIIASEAGLSNLTQFLETLSTMIICAKLHPAVTNAYWEKSYFAPTRIADYIIDLKYLYKKFEELPANDVTTCNTLSNIKGKLEQIETEITSCQKYIAENNNNAVKISFNYLNTYYSKLKSKVDDIIVSFDGIYTNYNWKKLLLSIVYNINNVESFSTNGKSASLILHDLKVLQTYINDYYVIGYFMTCKKLPVYNRDFDNEINQLGPTRTQAEYKGISKKLTDISSYSDFFRAIDGLFGAIVRSQTEDDFVLYWDGVGKTLENVYDKYRIHSLDQLQMNYDYIKFLIRWLLSIVYARIIDIIKEIKKANTSDLPSITLYNVFYVDELQLKFNQFQDLPLYISMPVGDILDRFVYVLKSYDGVNDEDLDRYITVLEQELEKLGYVTSSTLTVLNYTFSSYIQLLIETINGIIDIYEVHRTAIQNSATNVGVDLNDVIMMFHEWK